MVLAMVVCAFAIMAPASEGDSESMSGSEFVGLAKDGVIDMTSDVTITDKVNIVDMTIRGNGFSITSGSTITLQGTTIVSDVQFISSSGSDLAITDVAAGSNVTLDGCSFSNEKCTTAVYVNSNDSAKTTVSIENCKISGNDKQLKEVIVDGPGAKVSIDNCTGLRINLTNGNGNCTYTLGTDLNVSNSFIDRLNIDASCGLTVNKGDSLNVGLVRGAGSVTNNGAVFAYKFENTTVSSGLTFVIPAGTTATYDFAKKTVAISGNAVAASSEDSTYSELFGTAKGTWAYMGILNLATGNVNIVQKNTALSQAYPEEKDFADNVKEKDYTGFDGSYYFLVPADGSKVTVTFTGGIEGTYTFDFSDVVTEFAISGTVSDVSGIDNAQKNGTPVVIEDATGTIPETQVTDAGMQINTAAGSEVSAIVSLGTYDKDTFNSTGTVELKGFQGTVRISHGSAVIEQGDIDKGDVTVTGEKDVVLQNVTVNGAVTITIDDGATLRIGSNVAIGESGTLTINAATGSAMVNLARNITMDVDGDLVLGNGVKMNVKGTIDSSVNADKTIAGDVVVGKGATVVVDGTCIANLKNNGGTIVNNSVSGGPIDLTDGTTIDKTTSINGSNSQEIIVNGTVTVKAGGYIIVNGTLNIAQGAELVLEEGASLVIGNAANVVLDGTVTVAAGTASSYTFQYNGYDMQVNGTLDLEGAYSFLCSGEVTVTGTVNVGEEASVNFEKGMTVAAEGVLNINGEATTGAPVVNHGTVNVDSEVAVDIDVQMRDKAVLDLTNATGNVTVSDSGMTFRYNNQDKAIVSASMTTIGFENVSGVVVSETLITENVTGIGGADRVGYGNMAVSGNADVATNLAGDLTGGSIEISAGIARVTETLNLDAVTLTVGSGAALDVSGELVTVNDKFGTVAGTGEVDVSGKIVAKQKIDGPKVNAAHYVTSDADKYNVYTTLDVAIADGAKAIDLLGDFVVDYDVTIPAGVKVDADTANSVTIAEDRHVTVAFTDGSSAKLQNDKTPVDVKGTLTVENLRKSGVDDGNVLSDVATINGDLAVFTSIYNALNNAAEGDTVTITREGEIVLDRNIEVKTGVVLVIPDISAVVVDNGITVTVNGTVENEGRYTMESETSAGKGDEGRTVVNGLFKTTDSDQYKASIAGAYFIYDGVDCIAPLSFVGDNADDMESDVQIYGDNTVATVEIAYTAGEKLVITVTEGARLTVENLSLSGVEFVFAGRTTGTVTMCDAEFVLKDVQGGTISDVTGIVDDVETHVATLSGNIVNGKETADETESGVEVVGSITVNGTAAVDTAGEEVSVAIIAAEGATVSVSNTEFAGDVTVTGNVVIAGTGVTFATITVTGTIAVAEGEDLTATVTTLYAGVSVEEKDGKKIVTDLGTGASVSGLKLGSNSTAYVSPEAKLGAGIVDAQGMKSTEYYVEDALFVTAYTTVANLAIGDIDANVVDARFNKWMNDEKADATSENVGAAGFEKVYADIDYDVYSVTIRTDGGIGSVAIDGLLMSNEGGNVFTMDGLKAGQHTVTYTLKSGFTGTATLSSADVSVSGMTFTLTGDFEQIVDDKTVPVEYVLDLAGTEPKDTTIVVDGGDNGKEGLGLTDILLIVLVVLIVIMAIIVAMRLMRS